MASGVLSSLVGAGIIALTYPIYLHYLGYERYGLWLLLSTILTFAQLGNLGIAQAVSKQVAEAYGSADVDSIQECVTNAVLLLFLSGSLVIVVLLLARARIISAMHLSGGNADIAASIIPFMAFLSVYVFIVDATNATLAGLGRMDLCNYSQLASQLLSSVAGILMLRVGAGLAGLVAASAFSYLCLHIASTYAIRRLLNDSVIRCSKVSIRRAKHLLGFGLGLTGGAILAMILNPVNKIILARYAGLNSLPTYDLSFLGCMRLRNLFDSSQRAIVPEVSRMLARSRAETSRHARRLNKRSVGAILCALPLYVALIIGAPTLLQLWLRSSFDPSSPLIVRIMLVGAFASLLSLPAYYTLVALGCARSIFISAFVQLGVNLLLIAISIGLYSTVTPAFVVSSTSAGMASASIYLILRCRRATAVAESPVESPSLIANLTSV